MDPTACLRRMLDHFEDDNYEECGYAADDLANWLAKRGYNPDLSKLSDTEIRSLCVLAIFGARMQLEVE